MSARISETDFGTKGKAIKKIEEIQDESPAVFNELMFRFLQKVYLLAVEECPAETGALRKSIRIVKGKENVGGPHTVAKRQSTETEFVIAAGGGGVINPKSGKIVDYAECVHNGFIHPASGRFIPGNPFLDRAMQRAEGELDRVSDKYGEYLLNKWREGDLKAPPTTWQLPLTFIGKWRGMEV